MLKDARSAVRAISTLLCLAVVAASCSGSVEISGPNIEQAPPASVEDSATPAPPDEGGQSGTASPEPDEPPGSDRGTEAGPVDVQIAGRFTWEETGCEFDEPMDVTTTCGWLEVPERWDDPSDGDTVRLHVGIFSAGATDLEPTVYLEGGPGGDALANIGQSFGVFFAPLTLDRDLVVIGQRGTGSAEPHLQCDNVLELELDLLDDTSGLEAQIELAQAAYAECAEGFHDQGIDPSAFNSVQNAHDVEALRLALGHNQWNVLGISYGTRLAQTLMRLHPGGIRSVILDSVLTTERDPSIDQPVTAKRSFEVLFEGCANSATCASEFGNLEARYFSLVDELDSDPLSFEVSDLLTAETYPAVLDGLGLMEQTFGALYSKSAFSALPELIEQLESGDTSGIAALVSQSVSSAQFVATGMFWSVECNEEVPFITPESIASGPHRR